MVHNLSILVVAFLVTLPNLVSGQTATYMGNTGIFIEYDGSKVLIDGLFEDPTGRFDYPDEATISKIIGGKAPYDGINILLNSDAKSDHFDPFYVGEMLKKIKDSRLITTPQGTDSLKAVVDDVASISNQVLAYPFTRSWKYVSVDGVKVKTTYTKHAGKINAKLQNYMFLVTIKDKKILHFGDTQMDVSNFDKLKIPYEEVDIAFVPFWFLTSLYGKEILDKHIQAKTIIGVHMPSGNNDKLLAKIRAQNPDVRVFQNVGEKVSF